MIVRNYLRISDDEFLARSIRNWQEALRRGNYTLFEYWAMHAIRFVGGTG